MTFFAHTLTAAAGPAAAGNPAAIIFTSLRDITQALVEERPPVSVVRFVQGGFRFRRVSRLGS